MAMRVMAKGSVVPLCLKVEFERIVVRLDISVPAVTAVSLVKFVLKVGAVESLLASWPVFADSPPTGLSPLPDSFGFVPASRAKSAASMSRESCEIR